MIEPEVAFADLDDVAILGTNFIKALIQAALTHCPEEMEFLQKNYKPNLIETLKQVVAADFKKITYTEAIEILKNSGKKFEFKPDWGINLQTEHERYLTDEHFKLPVIVTDYPRKIKAFYMKVNPDQKTVRAMDILVPEVGEIIGGSQREDRLEMLIEGLKLFDLDPKEYDWYLDLRRHGGCPHAGFGLGFERAVRYITGMDNIRDVIAFPRTPGNLEF
jgi:asparaginyl-tRNA synthetase